jgi:hypothetical protein
MCTGLIGAPIVWVQKLAVAVIRREQYVEISCQIDKNRRILAS